jgi:lipopolysaccharide export system protein LptA|tara:strand:+ start:883 stop:1365 length:483 start_codon:yes stop_codon:yes gene_type:complete
MKIYFKLFTLIILLLSPKVFAQNATLSLNSKNHDVSLPVEITANSLLINQASNTAIFEGNARVGQGLLRLAADKIIVIYNQGAEKVDSIKAMGNVLFTNGEDIAKSENAVYEINSGLLKMSGKVHLIQGKNMISGNYLDMNILKNIANLSGNVKTILAPN